MQSKFKRLRHFVLNIFRVGQDIYCVYSQCMALDSFHAQIQISNSKCDMGHFPIFNKTWLSWTGKADICCYNSVPNTVPGWLVTSFNRAKCWETSLLNSAIFSFKLQQESSGPPLYLCLSRFDLSLMQIFGVFNNMPGSSHRVPPWCWPVRVKMCWSFCCLFIYYLGAVYFMISWREAKCHVSVPLQLSLRSRSFFP